MVGEASNGREAVEQARRLRPEVIVMDISMPEMNGIDATRIIKSEMPQIRVIGLSMHVDQNISKAMYEAGADAFISKTVGPAGLLEAIYAPDRGKGAATESVPSTCPRIATPASAKRESKQET